MACFSMSLAIFRPFQAWAHFPFSFPFSRDFCAESRERAEYCFESTVSEERTHWVLRQTRWVLPKTRWVRFCTQIIGWEELTEFRGTNSVSRKKLTELGVWNRTPRNHIRPFCAESVSHSEMATSIARHKSRMWCGFVPRWRDYDDSLQASAITVSLIGCR